MNGPKTASSTKRSFLSNMLKLSALAYSSILFPSAMFANSSKRDSFTISINGDLDDDLIVLKSTPLNTRILDIYQMHNPSGQFEYNKVMYKIKECPGFINFAKRYFFGSKNEIYIVALANEREEAHITKRIRTHYKNEKLLYNGKIFLPALMPEYNSVPNYPVWFQDDDTPTVRKEDINGNTYNYYHLFDNTIIQLGLVFPTPGNVRIRLYGKNNELIYTFEEEITFLPKNLRSNELKQNLIKSHPFTEIGDILNESTENEIRNENIIKTIVIEYRNDLYVIAPPYPLIYPNLIFGVANHV